MFCRIFLLIFSALFISLNLTGQTISTVSKKTTSASAHSEDSSFTVPSDLVKGSSFAITFDQLSMNAKVTILDEQANVVFPVPGDYISGQQSSSRGNITAEFEVHLSPGDYILKETYDGQVDAAESQILIPTIKFQQVVIERAFRFHFDHSCQVRLKTQISSLKAQVIGDFQGNVSIEQVGKQVELPLKSVRDMSAGEEVKYQTEFSVYVTSNTSVLINSREVLFDANKHSLLQQNFDGLTLQNSVDEGLEQGISGVNVWTRVGPSGWKIETPLVSDNPPLPAGLGVEEWTGWSFTEFDWWVKTAGDQGRGNWTSGKRNRKTIVAVLDSDEWDDEWDDEPYEDRSPDDYVWLNSTLFTRTIDISSVAPNSVEFFFDSSFRMDPTQTFQAVATFDNGSEVVLLHAEAESTTTLVNHYGLEFDGVNDYLSLAVDGLPTNNFTFESWINPRTTSGIHRIMSTRGPTGTTGFGFGTNDDKLRFTTFGIKDYDTSTGSIPVNTWTHVAVVFDLNNDAHFYINGDFIQTVSGPERANSTDADLLIGRLGPASPTIGSGIESWNGLMDDGRFWQTARTAKQIKANYNKVLTGNENLLSVYLKLDENSGQTAYDSTANGLNAKFGTLTGNHSALEFDGSDDFVSLGNEESLKPVEAITVEAWIKPYVFSDWAGIITNLQDNGIEESGYGLFYYPDANGMAWWISTQDSAHDNYASFPNISVDLNQWTHLAETYSSTSGEMKLYKNGTLVDSKAITGDINWDYAPDDCRLADYHDDNEDYFLNGAIDEVRIWNVARSEQQIKDSKDLRLSGSEVGLTAYYQFNQTGQDVIDTTSNNNHGTLGISAADIEGDPTRIFSTDPNPVWTSDAGPLV